MISSGSQVRSSSTSALNRVEMPRHYRQLGRILSVSPDGTQMIELMRPPHGPYGFFIARGKARYNHGEHSMANSNNNIHIQFIYE